MLAFLLIIPTVELFSQTSVPLNIDLGDHHITKAHVILTHESGIVREADLKVDNENRRAYGVLTGLEPGRWVVEAELYEGDMIVGRGKGSMVIEAGKETEINIRVTFELGSARINVLWGREKRAHLFSMEFSSKYLKGVNVKALKEKGYDYKVEGDRIIWKWESKYKEDYLHTFDCIICSAKGVVEYDRKSGTFRIGIDDMDSLKFLLTLFGSYFPANKSRVVTYWIFGALGKAISDGVVEIHNKALWENYALWWIGVYRFNEVKIYNNTGHDLKVVIEYLYGNELWFKSGYPEAERRYLLPVARRWSPFDNVDDVGRVRENGDAYLQFTARFFSPYRIFTTAVANNDNGESSGVSINGEVIVKQEDCGLTLKQLQLPSGRYTVRVFGHKTWSHLAPRITMLVIDGNIEVEDAEIYPDRYGDPRPMVIHIPKGMSIIESEEEF